jgi:hypothetical protein
MQLDFPPRLDDATDARTKVSAHGEKRKKSENGRL